MIASSGTANAQNDVTGAYYLKGVMETASGFKLNADSTFRFFYSSGALDRTGEGKWERRGNTIVFNSRPYPGRDFKLLKSEHRPGDSVTVKITDRNELLTSFVYAGLRQGTAQPELINDRKGAIRFGKQAFDALVLAFEFCPERLTVIPVADKSLNYFELAFEEWLMDVFFSNFTLTIEGNDLKGGHPMMTRGSFTYEKEPAQ